MNIKRNSAISSVPELFLIACLAISLLQTETLTAQSVTIHGHVSGVDKSGGAVEPIANAEIRFLSIAGDPIGQCTSDRDGYYQLAEFSPGTIRYEVYANGYQIENVGRAIEVQARLDAQTLDFMLVQGKKPSDIPKGIAGVRVWDIVGPNRKPAENVRVWAREARSSHMVESSLDATDPGNHHLELSAGTWQISVTSPARPPVIHPTPIEINDGSQTEIEVTLETNVHAQTTTVQALVSIQKTAALVPDPEPVVNFFQSESDNPLPANLEPVSEEDLEFLGSSEDQDTTADWVWYWAQSQGPLPAGEYFAQATFPGIEPVTTANQLITGAETSVFHLTIRPQDQLGKLVGTVAEQKTENARKPIANWMVVARNSASHESRSSRTNDQGKYALDLAIGTWWVHAEPPRIPGAERSQLPNSNPLLIEISSAGAFENDITIVSSVNTGQAAESHVAVVGVQLQPGTEIEEVPTVQFVSEGDLTRTVTAKTERLEADQLEDFGLTNEMGADIWRWYLAKPNDPIATGVYEASASLSGYGSRSSSPATVSEGESAFFHITMTPTSLPGILSGRVVHRDTGQESLIRNAQIQIWNEDFGRQEIASVDGSFEVGQLEPGLWWATASASGYALSTATPIQITAGKSQTIDIPLTKVAAPKPTNVVAIIGIEHQVGSLPYAQFIRRADGNAEAIGSKVGPLTYNRACEILKRYDLDPSWTYFEARPVEPLSPGSYHLVAEAENHESETSLPVFAIPGFTAVIDVSLFHKIVPKDGKVVAVHGHVAGQNRAGERLGPLKGARIVFTNAAGNVVGESTSDPNGYYLLNDLPLGELTYQVRTDGFRTENAGRAIHLRPQAYPTVVDFVMTKANEPMTARSSLDVGVWARSESGKLTRIDNAAITVWSNNRPESRTTTQQPTGQDRELKVRPGTYWISANASGYVENLPEPISVGRDDVSHKIVLKPNVGETRVLVSVQRNQLTRAIPQVQIQPEMDGPAVNARLEPIADDEIAILNPDSFSTDISTDWYWGLVEQDLEPGSYFALAQLDGYESVSSSIQELVPGSSKVFHVTMKLPKLTYRLTGSVTSISQPQNNIANAVIQFENSQSGERHRIQTNEQGSYKIVLEPGNWWAVATPPADAEQLLASTPVQIKMPAGQDSSFDFDLADQETPVPLAPRVRAIVEVPIGEYKAGTIPKVSFLHQDNLIFDCPTTLLSVEQSKAMLLPASSDMDRFMAIAELPAGSAIAEVKMRGFQPTQSARKPIRAGQTTTYFVSLTSKSKALPKGRLVARVYSAGRTRNPIDAKIQLVSRSRKQIDLSVWSGISAPERLEQGKWWAIAHADGFARSDPKLVEISPEQESVVEFDLKPIKKHKPIPPVFATINVVNPAGCKTANDAPQADFVNLDSHERVAAKLSLRTQTDTATTYSADPTRPLKQGLWRVDSRFAQSSVTSPPQQLSLNRPTVFDLTFTSQVKKLPVSFYVWPTGTDVSGIERELSNLGQEQRDIGQPDPAQSQDQLSLQVNSDLSQSLREQEIEGATITLVDRDSVQTVQQFHTSETQFLPPGRYWAKADAPGFNSSPLREINVGCEGQVRNSFVLTPSQRNVPQGKLIALVRVVDSDTKKEDEIIWAMLSPSPTAALTSMLAAPPHPRKINPTVSFIRFESGKEVGKPISALTVPITEENQEEFGVSVQESEKWFYAECPQTVPVGTYFAKAELPGKTEVVPPKQVNEVKPTVFNLVFLPENQKPQNGNLEFTVKDVDFGEQVNDAEIVIHNRNSGFVAKQRTDESGFAKFDVPSGNWSVSVNSRLHESYIYEFPVNVPSGGTEICTPLLKRKNEQLLPSGAIEVLVSVRKGTSSNEMPEITAECLVTKQIDRPELEQRIIDGVEQTVSVTHSFLQEEKLVFELNDVRKLTRIELQQRGVSENVASNLEVEWYVASRKLDSIESGQVSAQATLGGIGSAKSQTKEILVNKLTYLDISLAPVRPVLQIALKLESGHPAKSVDVAVWQSNANFGNAVKHRTDANGRVTIDLPKMGEYKLMATREGISPFSEVLEINEETVARTFEVASVAKGMTSFVGQIVADASGDPISNAKIQVARIDNGQNVGEPVTTQSNPAGEFRTAELPAGKYRISINADGFTNWSGDVDIKRGIEPTQFNLSQRNAALENALYQLLTEGWNTPGTAARVFEEAKIAAPENPVVDYAMGLVAGNSEDLSAATSHFGNAIRKRDNAIFWDRAADARFWIDIKNRNLERTLREMNGISTIYKTREANHASLDTSRLMGVAIALAKGSWRTPSLQNVEQTQRVIESNLNQDHLAAFNEGLQSVKSFDSAEITNADPAGKRDIQKRIEDLETQKREIDAKLNNKKLAVDNLIREYQLQIDRIRESFNPKQREIEQKTRERDTVNQQLKSLRYTGQGGSQAAADASHKILELGFRIRELRKAKTTTDTQIQSLESKQDIEKENFNTFHSAEKRTRDGLDSELEKLRQKLSDMPSNESRRSPLDELRSLNWEERRQEVLKTLSQNVSSDIGMNDQNNTDEPEDDEKEKGIEADFFAIGMKHFDEDELAGAETNFRNAIQVDANNHKALTFLGRTLHLQMKKGEDLDLNQLLQHFDRSFDIERDFVANLVFRGQLLLELDRLQESLVDFNRALDLDPNSPAAFEGRGIANFILDNKAEATRDFNRAIEEGTQSGKPYYYRGRLAVSNGDLNSALRDFDTSIQREPSNGSAFLERALVHLDINNHSKANSDLHQATRLDPNLFQAWFHRGRLMMLDEDYEKAIYSLNKANQIDDSVADVYLERGLALEKTNKNRQADRDYAKVVELTRSAPNELTANALAGRAKISYLNQRFDDCVSHAKQAIRIDPNLGLAHRMSAIGFMGKSQYQNAIADLSNAIRIDPDDFIAFQNRYRCYVALNDLRSALSDVDSCLRIQPANREIRQVQQQIQAQLSGNGQRNQNQRSGGGFQ